MEFLFKSSKFENAESDGMESSRVGEEGERRTGADGESGGGEEMEAATGKSSDSPKSWRLAFFRRLGFFAFFRLTGEGEGEGSLFCKRFSNSKNQTDPVVGSSSDSGSVVSKMTSISLLGLSETSS